MGVVKSMFVEKKMEKLSTPFGEITILIDGKPVLYSAQKGRNMDELCPHVLGRYQIAVQFIPDGEKHTIACIFKSDCLYDRSPESGERLECQSFYNDHRFKMSIGLVSDEYDYGADYLENGMAFLIDANTRTERYVFGISWIDNVGRDGQMDDDGDRDVETWYGADPSLAL